MMKMMRKNKGFTLIEILIVVIIIGILVLMAIPQLARIRQTAWTNTCGSNRGTLSSLSEAFYTSSGAYPANQAALIAGGFERVQVRCPINPGAAADPYTLPTIAAPTVACANSTGGNTPNPWADAPAGQHYQQ